MGIGRIETTMSEYITLTWGNGLTKGRSSEKARFQDYVGWFTAVGQSNEFDKAMEAAGFQIIELQHSDAIKKHWDVGESLQFLPITMGTPATSVPALLRMTDKASEAGIGVRWVQGESSKVGVVGYIKQLADNGVYIPVKVGAHSLMCEYLLRALADHTRACQFADSIVDRSKHPDPVELYEVILTLQAGEQVAFGKGNNTSLVVPIASAHPQELSKEYIVNHYITSDEVKAKAVSEFPRIQTWAKGFNNSAESNAESSESGNTTQSANGGSNASRKPAQQASSGKGEETTLHGMVFDMRVNEKRTWVGFKLALIDDNGEVATDDKGNELEQFCSVFFKGVVQQAIDQLSEGNIGEFTGYYEDEKFIVKKWVLNSPGAGVATDQSDAILPF